MVEDTGKSTRRAETQGPPTPSKADFCLFAILSLTAGLGLLLLVGSPKAVASLSWPTAIGVVVSSEVMQQYLPTMNETWRPRVSYTYSVDGKDYVSDDIEVIHIGNGNTDYPARQVVKRYPLGKRVQVYYAPGNPAVALLEPGMPDNDGFTYIIFLVGIAGGSLLLCAASVFVCAAAFWDKWLALWEPHPS